MSLLFRNFKAAADKNNLVRFGLFSPTQDLSWIDNAPNAPLTMQTVAFSATPAFDVSTGQIFTITLTGNVTSSSLTYQGSGSIPFIGLQVFLRVIQDATGGRAFSLPANLLADAGFAIDGAPNRCTVIPIQWNGSNWENFAPPVSFTI